MFFLVDMQCFFLLLVLPEGCRDCYDSLSIDFFFCGRYSKVNVFDVQWFLWLMCYSFFLYLMFKVFGVDV